MSNVGLYCDVANLYLQGGTRAQYNKLREFACRDGSDAMRLVAYVTFDETRAQRDDAYRDGAKSFHSKLRQYGYKVVIKPVRWHQDPSGNRYGKANADLDLAVDVLLQTERLDRILIASGDGDVTKLITAVQNRGCRVEVVGLDNTSPELVEEADAFLSGFLIPDFIPLSHEIHPDVRKIPWGEIGSRVRGISYWCESNGVRQFGYMRYLKFIGSGLWHTDARDEDSAWGTAYFRNSQLPAPPTGRHLASYLPSTEFIFEFTLQESDRDSGLQAEEIQLISSPLR